MRDKKFRIIEWLLGFVVWLISVGVAVGVVYYFYLFSVFYLGYGVRTL
jgi:hypothetical protein